MSICRKELNVTSLVNVARITPAKKNGRSVPLEGLLCEYMKVKGNV